MKKSELRSLIKEEIQKVLKEEKKITDPEEIIKYFKSDKTKRVGTYLFAGDQAEKVHAQYRDQILSNDYGLTPIYYTDNPRTNISNLIAWAEKTFPKYQEFTIAYIDKNGNIDVSVS